MADNAKEDNYKGKVVSQKELAIYVAYCIGFALLFFGTILPIELDQIWMSIVGATILVIAHVSREAMITRGYLIELSKEP